MKNKKYKAKIPKVINLWVGVQLNQILPEVKIIVPPTPKKENVRFVDNKSKEYNKSSYSTKRIYGHNRV